MHKILIIEDSHLAQARLGEIFNNRYELDFQDDGLSGIAAITTNRPDLILLDIRLPGIDGYEVCRTLKGNDNTREIPIIFMTALDAERDRVAGFEAGADDYVVKPFYSLELLERVKTQLALRESKKQALLLERLTVFQELAVAMSHELNNPLTSISAFIYYLQHELADAPLSIKTALDCIDQETSRIHEITRKLAISANANKISYNKDITMIDFRTL